MQRLYKQVTGISATNRSRVTNGTQLLLGVDGRSPSARTSVLRHMVATAGLIDGGE